MTFTKSVILFSSVATAIGGTGIVLVTTLNKKSLIDNPLIIGESVFLSEGNKYCQFFRNNDKMERNPSFNSSCQTDWSKEVKKEEGKNKLWLRIKDKEFKEYLGIENPEEWVVGFVAIHLKLNKENLETTQSLEEKEKDFFNKHCQKDNLSGFLRVKCTWNQETNN